MSAARQLRWTPGNEVEIVANRLRLRSLRASDVPGQDAPAWYGDAQRREHVWAPSAQVGRFLRGLAEGCDHRRHFALLAERRADGTPIGLAKGQVVREEGERLFVLTTLVGDRRHEGLALGFEISTATLFFATRFLFIDAISLRIYEENSSVIRAVEHVGYQLHRSVESETAAGSRRRVLDYRKSKKVWLATYADRYAHWSVRPLAAA